MTGEMIKLPNADKGEEYWKGKVGVYGYRILGDETYLIRPNYPEYYELRDELRKIGYKDADVEPWDVYTGPYIDLKGVDVGKTPYKYGHSLALSKLINSCQIWKTGYETWMVDCGKNNRKLLGTEEPFEGREYDIIEKLREIREKING